MKYIFIPAALWLLYGGSAFSQAKLNPDSIGVAGRERISSLQWSRKLKDGKAVYYLFDAQSNKTYPVYTAQFANYVFLGKDEAQNTYLSKFGGTGVPTFSAGSVSYLQPTAQRTGSTLVSRDADGKSAFTSVDVAGVVHAKEVLVNLDGFSDYVFDKDYKLPNLNLVKRYVDKNHHLPDMPSEKDIVSKGLNVGDITNILTKKIEELTLYAIEKDRELTAQKKQIEIISKRIGIRGQIKKSK